jgi:uncharacterized protein (TIGR02996 family)
MASADIPRLSSTFSALFWSVYLVVTHTERGERRWYGPNLAGAVVVGSAREADVPIDGHNLAARHVVLRFGPSRTRLEVKNAFGVRVDGRLPRANDTLGVLRIGPWELRVEERAPRGIDALDAEFLAAIERDPDARAVYADSLEERGRLAEAELIRGSHDPILAARTPPEWRRTVLPIAVEACARRCARAWSPNACDECGIDVPLFGNLAAARERALAGKPVALDPSVRRWPNDLREPVVRQPAIVMGQPRR